MKKLLIALLLCVCLLPVQVFAQTSEDLEMAIEKPLPQSGVLEYSIFHNGADEISSMFLSELPVFFVSGNYKISLAYEMKGEKQLKAALQVTYFEEDKEITDQIWIDYDYTASKLLTIYLADGVYQYTNITGKTEAELEQLNSLEIGTVMNPEVIYEMVHKLASFVSAPEYKDGAYHKTLSGEDGIAFLKEFTFKMVCFSNGVMPKGEEAEGLKQSILEYYDVQLKDVRLLDEEGVVAGFELDKDKNLQSASYTVNMNVDTQAYAKAMEWESSDKAIDAKGTIEFNFNYGSLQGDVPFPELTKENSVEMGKEEQETTTIPSNSYAEGWNIVVEGNLLGMKNAPYIENDRALAAGQALCYALGAEYTCENGVLTINNGEMVFTAGSDTCMVNGVEKTLEVTPKEIDHELFVPVRFLAEQLGYQVGFSQEKAADGETVYASIVLIDPANVKFSLLLPEDQTQQQQLAQLAAAMLDVELEFVNSPKEQHADWVAVMLASEEPAVIYETDGYSIENIKDRGLFYDLTSYIEEFAPETMELIRKNKDIQQAVMADAGAIIAFPVRFGERIEQFYIPLTIKKPDKVVQFLKTYDQLAKELIIQ